MGLGKVRTRRRLDLQAPFRFLFLQTIQTIAFIAYLRVRIEAPFLIVCPLSVLHNWIDEFKRIKDIPHFHNSYDYIRTKQEPGSIVWSHRDEENWILDPTVGIIVMAPARQHIRVFA